MTTFNLTNTADEVDTAIQAVVGADTSPLDNSQNMVTSDGVFNYVGTQLGGLAGKTITTESTGIASTDNDTSIPTSAAVKDYVDATTTSDAPLFGRLRIKIMPDDFNSGGTSSSGDQIEVPSGGSIYASTDIPAGYKATHFTLTTSGSIYGLSVSATVYEGQIDDGTLVSKGNDSASGTFTINMTDVTGSDDNYLVVKLTTSSGSTRYYQGGYFTLAAV